MFPILHQVCSSDFVSDDWISILKSIPEVSMKNNDWRRNAHSQFQLLSILCQLANKTINDAVHRFIMQSFITSSVLIENHFNIQFNTTLNQFFNSMIIYFGLLVNTVRLLHQVDQPLMGSLSTRYPDKLNIIPKVKIITNETNNQQAPQVCLLQNAKTFLFLSVNDIIIGNPYRFNEKFSNISMSVPSLDRVYS
jgi:hypothetical protein